MIGGIIFMLFGLLLGYSHGLADGARDTREKVYYYLMSLDKEEKENKEEKSE